MTEPRPSSPPHTPSAAPVPLRVAAGLTAAEGLAVVGYTAAGLFSLVGTGRAATGLAAGAFFVVYGAALVYFAWVLNRLKSWARSPIVLAQVIQVLVAWSLNGGVPAALAVGLTVAGLAVLVGIFHPASLRALSGE